MGRIFINYAREDVAVARKLYHDLKQAGADPWLDSEDLLPGQDWELEIKRAVKGSTYFIALISSHSVGKQGFVQKEIRFALDVLDELPPGKVYVIPTRLDDSTPSHERLSKIHWVDLFPSYDAGLAKIKESVGIAKRKTERAKPEAASRHEKRSPIGPDVPDKRHCRGQDIPLGVTLRPGNEKGGSLAAAIR